MSLVIDTGKPWAKPSGICKTGTSRAHHRGVWALLVDAQTFNVASLALATTIPRMHNTHTRGSLSAIPMGRHTAQLIRQKVRRRLLKRILHSRNSVTAAASLHGYPHDGQLTAWS